MDRTCESNKDIDEPASVVTDGLHLDRMEELPVKVAGSICCWGLHTNVAAIYGPHCHIECLRTSRCRKAIPNFLQVLGMSNSPPENAHNSHACPVYHVEDRGPWDVESPRHHWISCSMGKPIKKY
ncbi:unnamed protein product [Arctogadus glacialis]